MFIPDNYKNENIKEVRDFVIANSFGILITTDKGKSHATHIPIELVKNAKEEWILQGHIAKANSQWKHFNNGQDVLAIFNGPHSYVSSSWYDYEEVPTWNYVAVHIRGTIKIVKGEALNQALKHLVDKYEADSKHPISVDNLSKKTMRQVNGIVGFEIQIKDIQAAYKLSQGHNDENYKAVSEQLSQCPSAAAKEIANLMNSKRKLSK